MSETFNLHGPLSKHPYPTKPLKAELEREIRGLSRKTKLSIPNIKRLSMRAGLPIVRARLLGLKEAA